MNWTGGGLQRHSRKVGGSLTSRQKQHFAKVRGRLLNPHSKKSPIKWSLFNNTQLNSSVDARLDAQRQGDSSRTHYSSVPQDEGRLESSIQPQRTSRKPRKDSILYSSAATSTHRQHNERYDTSSRSREHRLTIKDEPEEEPYGDLYNTTPVPYGLSDRVLKSRNASISGGSESIEHKKRRLLMKGDWVGMGLQKPPHLTYASNRNDERVGKRRRVSDGYRKFHGAKRVNYPSFHPADILFKKDPIHDTRNGIRVTIDGQEVNRGSSRSHISGGNITARTYLCLQRKA